MIKIQNTDNIHASKDGQQEELSFTDDGNTRGFSHLGSYFGSFLGNICLAYGKVQQLFSLIFAINELKMYFHRKNLHTEVYNNLIKNW